MSHSDTRRLGVAATVCLGVGLIQSTPAAARVVNLFTVSDFVSSGGLVFSSLNVSGTFTTGSLASDFKSSVTVVETLPPANIGGSPSVYTYTLTGHYNGAGWGPLDSQQPPFVFPGFPDLPPSPMTFHIGLLPNTNPGTSSASFEDNLQINSGTVTINESQINAGVPEPGVWALTLLGFAGLGGALRRRRGRDVAIPGS